MNHPVARIWIDGGNAKILAASMSQAVEITEVVDGLVLRGIWAWLLQSL